MIIPCALALHECKCDDDPIANISAEAPDQDVFIGFFDFRGNPPLGVTYFGLGCKRICFSTESQRDADDCAQRQAKECVFGGWQEPKDPPIPPGPNGGPGGGFPPTPGFIPPRFPRNSIPVFRNKAKSCTVNCPDGTPFSETVAAGTVVALKQAEADEKATSLACKRANQDKLCFSTDTVTGGCVGTTYSSQFIVTGGALFSDGNYIWNFFGDLPPGLTLDGNTGVLSGTPITSGEFTFEIEVADANDNATTKVFTMCVMEIITDASLPSAYKDIAYAYPLTEDPGLVASEQWTLISGSLPPGISLVANGTLSGTATSAGNFSFDIQCVASCGSSSVTCSKSFNLEVIESAVDCMGNPGSFSALGAWTLNFPSDTGGTLTGGDGSWAKTADTFPFPPSFLYDFTTTICNPTANPYLVSVTFDWTMADWALVPAPPASSVQFEIDGAGPGTTQNGNGTFHFASTILLAVGVHNLHVRVTAAGFEVGGVNPVTFNGTVTLRPLTPP